MKPRLAVAFIALVLVPLAAVVWLTIRNAEHEKRALAKNVDALLLAELEAIARQLSASMEARAQAMLRVLDGLDVDAAAIREAVRKEPSIRQIFVVGADGRLAHPPLDAPRNDGEEAFLRRTEHIWTAEESFFRPVDQPDPKGTTARAPGNRGGWYTWYWGRDVNFIYWRLDDEGRIRGAELDRMALLAGLVGELPSTHAEAAGDRSSRIELVGTDGSVIYAFGGHTPLAGAAPRVSKELDAPLASWRLRHYPSPGLEGKELGRGAKLGAFAAAFVLALVVVALAIYVFRAAGADAREARRRVTFVNQVSHELKTPLTNIRMYAELLEEAVDEDDAEPRRYLGVIVSESQRLSRLIGNVLSLARKQRNKLGVRPAEGRADLAIAAVLDQFAPSLEGAGFEVVREIAPDAKSLVDEDALGQIVGNLVSNVEKYAAAGKRLSVRSRRDGDKVVVEVADRGPGIPRSQRERIFAPFVRLSDDISEGASGTGIGLAIARELARLHGGDLELEPRETGAAFILTLYAPLTTGEGP
ncbi:MAG: HAMP domain-containing histidine kinase [Proteobacteria bacterium]|nr:HAMP domain-containing histidine kinase [Pseudomonadota bacterium]